MTTEPTPPAVPVLDTRQLEDNLAGDLESVHLILATYLEELPGNVSVLEAALASGDAGDIMKAAHLLKGASANIGAEALRQQALRIETAGREGDLAEAAASFRGLPGIAAGLREAIETRLGSRD